MNDENMLKPLLIAVVLFLAFAVVSSFDYASALTDEAIRKDPPRLLGYTIKQDSPGLDRGEPMFPLHPPVASADIRAAKAKRRSTRERTHVR